MTFGRHGNRWRGARIALRTLSFVLFTSQVLPAAAFAQAVNSAATVTGSFSDSCTNFFARSTKDISHVQITYVDGHVEKDEGVNSVDFLINGDAGDEIDFVLVKSGTTRERFGCNPSPTTQCSDGLDNDGDQKVDFPDDSDCSSAEDNDEGSD